MKKIDSKKNKAQAQTVEAKKKAMTTLSIEDLSKSNGGGEARQQGLSVLH